MAFKKRNSTPTIENTRDEIDNSFSEILLKEYDGLLNLYTHTENSLNSIFNFYVTLLTTIAGAIIVIIQISQPEQGNLAWTVAALLVLIILFGIITQDFLIHKEAELAYFTLSINSLKHYLFKTFPEAQSQIFYLSNPYSHIHVVVHPLRRPKNLIDKLEKPFWWMLPLGMHQLFVCLMNSMALTAIFVLLILSLIPDFPPVPRLVIVSALVLAGAYVVQCVYANLKFKTKMKRDLVAMNGKVHPWFEDSKGVERGRGIAAEAE